MKTHYKGAVTHTCMPATGMDMGVCVMGGSINMSCDCGRAKWRIVHSEKA